MAKKWSAFFRVLPVSLPMNDFEWKIKSDLCVNYDLLAAITW